MTMFPRESAKFIVKHSKNVTINHEGIDRLSHLILEDLKSKKLKPSNFSQSNLHPKKTDSHCIDWIFVVDTLNFCFWTPGVGNSTKYRVEKQTGYFALCAAINRAMKENFDILNPNYYVNITEEDLMHIMRSDDGVTKIPLVKERVDSLREVGRILLDKYDGTFTNCIKKCDKSAQKLLALITQEFECYRDEATYHGQRVSLYKRAQILVGDIWSCFEGDGLGCFEDIDSITMFADYRVPQVLVHYGAMVYTDELNERLKKDELMENGCPDEVEIRGVSIHICELIKHKIRQLIRDAASIEGGCKDINEKSVNGILIDHFLWDYRRQHAQELEYIPFHKVLCKYY